MPKEQSMTFLEFFTVNFATTAMFSWMLLFREPRMMLIALSLSGLVVAAEYPIVRRCRGPISRAICFYFAMVIFLFSFGFAATLDGGDGLERAVKGGAIMAVYGQLFPGVFGLAAVLFANHLLEWPQSGPGEDA